MHDHSHEISDKTISGNAFIIGIALNSAFIVAEVIVGFITNSIALLTDAGHNLGDVIGLGISLLAFYLAKRKSSQSFTYGYRKTTVMAALLNAVILFVTSGILGYEAILRINKPEIVEGGTVAWVAGIGIIVNGLSAFFFFKGKGELNARGAYLHMLGDALIAIGVVIAGIIIKITHWYWLDSITSLIIIVTILISTWSLLKESTLLSLDAVPSNVDYSEIIAVIKNVNGVETVKHVHIWALSTTDNALTAHVVLDSGLSFEQKIEVVDKVKHELGHNNIHHSTIEMTVAEAGKER